MTVCAPVDFPLYGQAGTWPLRWLSMVDGRSGPEHPPWGITLAHSNGTRFVFVTTCPRDRFDAAFPSGSADPSGSAVPTAEVAHHLTVVQINLVLSGLERSVIDSGPGLAKALVRHAERSARAHRASAPTARTPATWTPAAWTVRGAGLPGDLAAASLTSLAGWRSGFTLDHPDVYLIVHAYGTGPDQPELMPVNDTLPYGFDAAGPTLPAEIPSDGFPRRTGSLHPDLRKVLADAEDPDHRDVGHRQVDSAG